MENEDVIDHLHMAIELLKMRKRELEAMKVGPDGPLQDRPDRFNRLMARIDMLLRDVGVLEFQLVQRETARAMRQPVQALSDARQALLRAGLADLDRSIGDAESFRTAIRLAMMASDAADDVAEATAMA